MRHLNELPEISHDRAHTLQATALAPRDIAPYGRSVVYAENIR